MRKIFFSLMILILFAMACGPQKMKTAENLNTMAEHNTKKTVEELLDKVFALWDQENYEEAMKYLEKAIQIVGDNEDFLDYKYSLQIALNKYQEALNTAFKLENISKRKSPWNCLKIAEAYIKLGNKKVAIDWVEKAVNERGFKRYEVLESDMYVSIKEDSKFNGMIEKVKENIGIDKPVQNFTVTLLNGEELTLSSIKGKVVLIDFWATWCLPCRKEFPNLINVYEEFREKSFEIIGINLDQNKGKLLNFMKEYNLKWLISYSGNGWFDSTVKLYEVNALPSTWLIDKKGILRHYNLRGKELKKAIQDLIL